MKKLSAFLGPLYPIVMTGFIMLSILTLSRLGLVLWQSDRITDVSGWSAVFVSGLRIDIATVCYLSLIPALLACFISGGHPLGRLWNTLLRVWIVVVLCLAVFMEVVTPAFILEYDLRPNRLFIEYLMYPKEVVSMLTTGYKLEIFLSVTALLITIFFGWRLSRYLTTDIHYPRWFWRPLMALLVIVISVAGARSTLGHRPLNPAMVAFASDPLVNDLVINSTYSVMHSASQMKSEANALDLYPPLAEETIISEVQASMNVHKNAFITGGAPTLAHHVANYRGKPKNIVILLLESHGARYVKSLGGINTSPNIDKLYDEGWGFSRMYATGTRSVRGIEAVTSGFSPTPARSVVKLGKSQSNFFTIARLLKANQYHTQFIYGGESHFDNMKSFFLGNGFVDMQDLPTFKSPNFVGSWGASDEDLYQKANEQFLELSKTGKPFFSLVFSSSNHTPYEYPEGAISAFNQPKDTVENAVKYADHALGQFLAKAKQSPYWDNTIFAVIADHDARASGTLAVPIGHFKIPAVIFGGGIEHREDGRLTSQIDLAPTLLSLAGIDSVNPMIGHDLTQTVPVEKQRAMMQRQKNFAWMTADNQVVILQPRKEISTWKYDPSSDALGLSAVNESIIRRAHANALWGSFAFRENHYIAQKSYQPLTD